MKQELIDFEHEIADLYRQGLIKAPIHLRGGYEDELIEIFKKIRPQDWVFSYWGSHLHCLLKGVPKDELKKAILDGKSIALSFPKYNIYCSGIVGSLAGVAAGAAWGFKKQNKDTRVFIFTGDMGAECGIFYESLKYVNNFELPCSFIIEDNGVSVVTDTKKTWGKKTYHINFPYYVYRFDYINTWPHSGIGQRIAF